VIISSAQCTRVHWAEVAFCKAVQQRAENRGVYVASRIGGDMHLAPLLRFSGLIMTTWACFSKSGRCPR
jgi:hypothetical protein